METGEIEVKLRVSQTVDVPIHVEEIIVAINELPITRRWNVIAAMLNYVDTNEEELTASQKDITINWLKNKLEKFQNI